MKQTEILVVEQEKGIRNAICTILDTRGYHYRTAETAQAAQAALGTRLPSLLLLDLALPGADICGLIGELRSRSSLPILLLTGKGSEKKKVEALDAGADDYLNWPFSAEELTARLRAAENRMGVLADPHRSTDHFQNGGLEIDRAAGRVTVEGQEIRLTPIEFRLLSLLAENAGRVLTHNAILREVWGAELPRDTPSLRVFMATLRKKVEIMPSQPKYIQTHIGVGYRMLQILPPISAER